MKIVTESELEEKITFIDERSKMNPSSGPNVVKLLDNKYSYFEPDCTEVHVWAKEHIIPLSIKNYGFQDDRIVKLEKANIGIKLSESSMKEYESLVKKGMAPLNEALEIIAKCVNDSVAFDIDAVEENYESKKPGWDHYKTLLDALKTANYKTRGDETINGICSDAGKIIRHFLANTIFDENLRCSNVGARSDISRHDTTIVFDIYTKEWAVLNSKSPLKPYNLVPKERLIELGDPYS